MRFWALALAMGICAVLPPPPANAADKTIRVTTLEWPPYTGENMPAGGATTEVLRQAFAAAGYDIDVVYRPWKRAIAMAKNGDESVIAYYPGYHCRHAEGFTPSEPLGTGPLGFAEDVDRPLSWESLDEIGEQKLKIGTVLGYSNTDEFDAKAGTGWIRAIPAKDDVTNLKKLMRGRVDAAVIDRTVLSYLLATDPELKDARDRLQFNAKPLEEKTLYLCFNENNTAEGLRQELNQAIKTIDVDAVVEKYFEEAFN